MPAYKSLSSGRAGTFAETLPSLVNINILTPNISNSSPFSGVTCTSVESSIGNTRHSRCNDYPEIADFGGYSEVYALNGGVYTRDKLSQALLVNMGGGVYQRQLTDGSIQEYGLSDGASPAKIFMTKVIDPQGNETLVQYDSDFRITTITDPIGDVSTLTYVSNTFGNSGFYKVAQISDPFSRTCSFTYDSANTNLMTTTDVLGLQSKMVYDTTNTFVTSLQTPYGTTSFHQYTPAPAAYATRGLRINYPDGTSYVIETWIGHEPLDATFIWDREATELYPNDPDNHDFTHCYKIAWLWGPVDGYLWPIIDYFKAGARESN